MRIAFVSDVDPYDRAAFSGSTYQILQIILATGAKVEVVGPVMDRWRFNAIRLIFLTSLGVWPTFGKGWARRIGGNLLRAAS